MAKEKVQEQYPAMFNFVTLILLNVTFWECSSYPRHILDYINIGGRLMPDEILAFLVNFFYNTIYFFCLIVFFTRGKSVFSLGIFIIAAANSSALAPAFNIESIAISKNLSVVIP